MIEVTVHDVMLRAPRDDPEAEWLPGRRKKYKLGFTRVMLLKELAGDRILPIWVGAVEGDSIAMLLAGLSMPRPSTFELTAQLLNVAKMTVEKIAVTQLRDDTYYATMWVKVRGKIREVDARPSDAITLAERPEFGHGEVAERPIAAPNVRSTKESAAARTAPANTAPHSTKLVPAVELALAEAPGAEAAYVIAFLLSGGQRSPRALRMNITTTMSPTM